MAHAKAVGSTKLGRESESKRLGVKIQDGQKVRPGQIIVRQRGTKYFPGSNVKIGGDDTLYAKKSGTVRFRTKNKICFDSSRRKATLVLVQ